MRISPATIVDHLRDAATAITTVEKAGPLPAGAIPVAQMANIIAEDDTLRVFFSDVLHNPEVVEKRDAERDAAIARIAAKLRTPAVEDALVRLGIAGPLVDPAEAKAGKAAESRTARTARTARHPAGHAGHTDHAGHTGHAGHPIDNPAGHPSHADHVDHADHIGHTHETMESREARMALGDSEDVSGVSGVSGDSDASGSGSGRRQPDSLLAALPLLVRLVLSFAAFRSR